MPVPSPYLIVLSGEEDSVLMARSRSVRSQYRDRLRARIVLAAAALARIARHLNAELTAVPGAAAHRRTELRSWAAEPRLVVTILTSF